MVSQEGFSKPTCNHQFLPELEWKKWPFLNPEREPFPNGPMVTKVSFKPPQGLFLPSRPFLKKCQKEGKGQGNLNLPVKWNLGLLLPKWNDEWLFTTSGQMDLNSEKFTTLQSTKGGLEEDAGWVG